jgi:hypothetical protein
MRSIYPCPTANISQVNLTGTLSIIPVKMIQYATNTWAVFNGTKVYVFDSSTGTVDG